MKGNKRLFKKKWIIFVSALVLVVALGMTVFFACSDGSGGGQVYTELPAESMSYSLTPPDDGSLPDDHTALENLGYIVGRLSQRSYYHTDSVSTADATALLGIKVTQNVTGTKDYKDGVLIVSSVSISGSSFAPSKALQRFIGEDKAVVRTAASDNKDDWKGGDTEWSSGDPSEILSREDYTARYGLWPTEFSDYVLTEDTILSFSDIVKEGDSYLLSFELEPESATRYYRNQMMTMGELSEPPVFSAVRITLRYAEDWSVSEMRIEENYTSKKGIEASVVGTTVVTYSYEEADVDVSDYEEYFINYAQAENTGAADQERTATDYLAEGFASVLVNERTAFSVNAEVAGEALSGKALLSMGGGSFSSLQLALGELNILVDVQGGDIYCVYKDFNGRLALSDLMGLIGGGAGMEDLMPALEGAIAEGIVSIEGENVSVTVSLPLGDILLPIEFGFSDMEAGISWTYIDASLELFGTEVSLHVIPAPADTELAPVDTESSVDLFPYIEDILALVQGTGFSLSVEYTGEGFAVSGEAVVDAANGAVSGEVVFNGGGISVPVLFTYAGGEVWLSAGGAKVRAQAGEWLNSLGELLDISIELPEIDIAGILGALVSADYDTIIKGLDLTEKELSLRIDGSALLAAFAPEAGLTLGDIAAVYDRSSGNFTFGVLGAKISLAGTQEEVSLPKDADGYVLLRPDDVLQFIQPITALANAKDIAFEGYAETEIGEVSFALDLRGEVWFSDPESVRVYLEIIVNDTENIRIYYADGKVTLAYGAYGMEIKEADLKSIAEKFSSLFAAEEGIPVSALLLSSDGLDLSALLEGIKLLGVNENGIQFAADLSALLDGMNFTVRIGASEKGLTLTEGGLTAAGVALKNVSAQVYAAENAFAPDFSSVTMCENVFELILNAYIQFADSEFLTLSFDYEDESMKADLTAALRLKKMEKNIVFELAAEAVISAGGSNYYMQVSVVDTYAYIYFSLIGFENSVYYPEAVAEGASPLRAKIAVSSLFDMSAEAMPLIVSLLGLNKNELYYFNFVVELLGGTYDTINSDIFGTKSADEWADLIIGIIKEYTGDGQAQSISSEDISVSFDTEDLALILSGGGMNVVLSAGGEREIVAPSDGYTDYSTLADLVKVLMGSITQSKTIEDAEGNLVESAEINSYYYLSGKVTAALDLGILGKPSLTDITVAASVYVDEDFGVTVNLHMNVPYFIAVIKEDTQVDITIEGGMVYIVRKSASGVIYRVSTLGNFFGDFLSHLGFLFNFSDLVNNSITGGGSGDASAAWDIGNILTSYSYSGEGAPAWTFGLNLSAVTNNVLGDATLILNADESGTLKGMTFSTSLSVLALSATLDYVNPGESMESGHASDVTKNVADEVRALFDKAIDRTDWSQTSYIEGKTATLTYVAEGQTLGTQTVAYNTATGELLTYTDLPDLSGFNGGDYTYSWGAVGNISGDTTLNAVKTPNEYTVTIRSEYEIDGLEYVRIEDGYFIYELVYTYGTCLDLPVGTEYGKMFEIVSFDGEMGEISSVENITSDIVLTAVWEEIEYTVTYTVLGEVYMTQTYGYGDALEFSDAYVDGFTFEGWATDVLAVENDMTIEAILSVTVTLGSDFAAEGFVLEEDGSYMQSYSLQGTAEEDFVFDLPLTYAGYAQFGWWHEGNGWQYVSTLSGLDGEIVWTAWIEDISVNITEVSKDWKSTWTVRGDFTGGAFAGKMSQKIAESAGIASSSRATLFISKSDSTIDDELEKDMAFTGNSFGKSGMTSWNGFWSNSYGFGGAKVAVTYTFGDLSLTLEDVGWKAK